MVDPPADEQLAKAAQSGDRDAFGVLVERHRSTMVRLAGRLLADADEAEDAVQEAVAGALRKMGQLEEPAKFTAWLSAIVINECRQRARRGRPLLLSLPDAPAPAADRPSQARQLGALLARTAVHILHLPPTQAAAAAWFYFHGAPHARIAECLHTTPAAVQSALQRARTTLRERQERITSEGESLMDNHQVDLRHVAETPQVVVEDLSLGDPHWDKNRFTARVTNHTDGPLFIALDIRACTTGGSNWQRQHHYRLEPREERVVAEPYGVNRVLCPWYAVFRGPGAARIRVTFAVVTEDEYYRREYIVRRPDRIIFQRWFDVVIPADGIEHPLPPKPALPAAGEVTLEAVGEGPTAPGTHELAVTLRNRAPEVRRVRLHVETPGFGGGRSVDLPPGTTSTETVPYTLYRDWQRHVEPGTGAPEIVLTAVQYPLNYDQLDLGEMEWFFWSNYVREAPAATVAVRRLPIVMDQAAREALAAHPPEPGERSDAVAFLLKLTDRMADGQRVLGILEALAEEAATDKMKAVVEDARRTAAGGGSISDALQSHRDLFPPMVLALIRDGERFGELDRLARSAGDWLRCGHFEVDPCLLTDGLVSGVRGDVAVGLELGAREMTIDTTRLLPHPTAPEQEVVWVEYVMPDGTRRHADRFVHRLAARSIDLPLKHLTIFERHQSGDVLAGVLRIRLDPAGPERQFPITYRPLTDGVEIRIGLESEV